MTRAAACILLALLLAAAGCSVLGPAADCSADPSATCEDDEEI